MTHWSDCATYNEPACPAGGMPGIPVSVIVEAMLRRKEIMSEGHDDTVIAQILETIKQMNSKLGEACPKGLVNEIQEVKARLARLDVIEAKLREAGWV